MIVDLTRGITAAMHITTLSATNTAKMRKKLFAAAIDPLFKSLGLEAVRRLRADGHGLMIDEVIQQMTLAQMKALSKLWNPNRKLPKEPIHRELQMELRDLAASRREPAPPPPPKPRGSSRKAKPVAAR
ncbi:hypothetical protein GC169_02520 [bacterium]|nr:hypothetical protein [bacterium]